MTNSATGTYTYTFTTVGGVEYTAWIKRTYRGQVSYREVVFTASGDTTALTGLTLQEVIATILDNDARSTASGHLGDLLGYAVTKPDCVFYQYPQKDIPTPLVSYRFSGESGRFPKNVFLDIVAWGGSLRAIHNRVSDLLDARIGTTATDCQIKGILFESAGPELYDDDLKCHYQRARYRLVIWPL